MKIIVWRPIPDFAKIGLEQFQKIIDEYQEKGITIINKSFMTSTLRLKVEFSNGDTMELLPAQESDIRGRRYDIGYISKAIDERKQRDIVITNSYIFNNHDENIRYY